MKYLLIVLLCLSSVAYADDDHSGPTNVNNTYPTYTTTTVRKSNNAGMDLLGGAALGCIGVTVYRGLRYNDWHLCWNYSDKKHDAVVDKSPE